MPPRRRTTTATFSLYSTIFRHFSAAGNRKQPPVPNPSKIRSKCKPNLIKDGQKALTDYLSTVKSLPYFYVERISYNSPFCLYKNIISKVEASSSDFYKSVQRYLRYNPVNEFEFFYESIGIDYSEIGMFLPQKKFFLSQDMCVFDAACALDGFGFPWNKLGVLYKDQFSIFSKDPSELIRELHKYTDFGFNGVGLCGICLAFPYVLGGNSEIGGEIDALFDDLKRVFVDFGLGSDVEDNVDAWCCVCRKIKLFYDLGCPKGEIGELMGRCKDIFVEHSEEVLVRKIEYFCRLDVRNEEVGLLLLSKPEIFKLDLESPMISVLKCLKHFGLEETKLSSVIERFPYVFGRNRLANLPQVMKSLDLNHWFFSKMKNGDHHLLGSYVIGNPDEGLDKEFADNLVKIESSYKRFHALSKLEFLHGIGYGENKFTFKVLKRTHGYSSKLHDRFDFLLTYGISFSKLCKMVSTTPCILRQSPENLSQKLKFLCEDMCSSLQYLDLFPSYLCFHLETRIRPRYRFHMWLKETGLSGIDYSISSMAGTSEKKFIDRIYKIHPALPKKWLELFLVKN